MEHKHQNAQHGLYHRANEHDACGVGFVAQIDGTPSHRILELGIRAVGNVMHRGAVDADAKTGDGAGVLTQIPRTLILRELASQFEGDYQLRFHIGASWVTGGVAKKIAFGPWLFKGMKLLAKLRFLRGTALDPFGWQSDRKLERRLITEFEQLIGALLSGLSLDNLATATELVKLYEGVRGFGHIKEAAYRQASDKQKTLLEQFRQQAGKRKVA